MIMMKARQGIECKEKRANAALGVVSSFLLPFFLMLVAMLLLEIIPFGKHNLALSDGRSYMSGIVGFGRFMKNGGSMLYGYGSLGGNGWSGWAWGGFYPTKLLSYFADIDTAPEVFTWMTLLNISLCGLTMYLLLAGLRGHRSSHLIFSTSYALIGFNVVYCHEHLFFIGPQMLPLVVLGLIWLLNGRAPWLYLFSLMACITLNCYFGYMLCAVSVIVFFAYLYTRWEDVRGRLGRVFATCSVSSLIAGLMPAFMWLPAIKAYSGGEGRLDKLSATDFSIVENMPFVQLFSKLFTGAISQDEVMGGLPNIFCGMFAVALAVVYLLNRRIDARRRRTVGVILLGYLLCFYIPALNILMHGGSVPNGFPYRYSFVFSFFMIAVAAEAFAEGFEMKAFRCAFALIAAGCVVVFATEYEFISGVNALADLALLALMGAVLYLRDKWTRAGEKRALAAALLLLVCVNLFANFALSIYKIQDMELDLTEYRENTIIAGSMIDAIKATDQETYRIEKDFTQTGDTGTDAGLYGYKGVTGFSPATRNFIRRSLSRLGLNWSGVVHWYTNSVPSATDTLLGLRYLISVRDLEAEKGYERRVSIPGFAIYRNNDALPFGFLADAACQALELGDDAFDNLNRVWRTMTGGDKDVFVEHKGVEFSFMRNSGWRNTDADLAGMTFDTDADQTKVNSKTRQVVGNISFSFTATVDGPIYEYNMAVPRATEGQNTAAIFCLGEYKAGDLVEGSFAIIDEDTTDEEMLEYCANIVFATIDNSVVSEYARQLSERDMTFAIEKNTLLKGAFNAQRDQCMLFTIPWDEGWTAYIDGREVPIERTWDLFMTVSVPEGQHTYELRFFPAWMKEGIYISCAALAGLMVFMVAWRIGKKKRAGEVAA